MKNRIYPHGQFRPKAITEPHQVPEGWVPICRYKEESMVDYKIVQRAARIGGIPSVKMIRRPGDNKGMVWVDPEKAKEVMVLVQKSLASRPRDNGKHETPLQGASTTQVQLRASDDLLAEVHRLQNTTASLLAIVSRLEMSLPAAVNGIMMSLTRLEASWQPATTPAIPEEATP